MNAMKTCSCIHVTNVNYFKGVVPGDCNDIFAQTTLIFKGGYTYFIVVYPTVLLCVFL